MESGCILRKRLCPQKSLGIFSAAAAGGKRQHKETPWGITEQAELGEIS